MTDALRTPDRLALLEHRAWVRALAWRLLRNASDVDDVEQDTWTVALDAGPAEPRALRSWLGVVASRLALQRLRSNSRRVRREQTIAAADRVERSSADVVAEADAHGHVVQAVLALDEPYRTTVLLRFFEGLEIAAVAQRTGVPVETTRTRLKRAIERLRASLEREHGRPLALLLAPIGAALPTNAPHGSAVAPPSHGSAIATTSFAHAGLLAAGVIALAAGGAWLMMNGDDGGGPAPGGPLVAAVPQDDAAQGGGGAAAKAGDPGASGKARTPRHPPVAETPPDAKSPADDAWIAHDLADGKPLPDFALRVRTADGESVVRTDAAGRVPVDRANVLEVSADAWTLALPENAAVKDEPSLWFWRERGVTGTVRSADPSKPLATAAVKFTWSVPFDLSAKAGDPGRGVQWLMQRGFGRNSEQRVQVRVDAKGGLSGTAKAIRGAMLTAEADGFTPAASPLVWSVSGDCAITFEMRSILQIVGRLLDESGDPIVGQSVSLDAAVEVSSDAELAHLQAMRPHGGYTFGGKSGDGLGTHGVVDLVNVATTDVRGIFRFEVPAVGAGVVYAFREGCAVCRKELGTMDKDVTGFQMTVARSDARVLVRDSDAVLASSSLTVQVADSRENGFALATDAEGRADAGWLQTGRWYRISRRDDPTPGRSGCFRWDGQGALDLDQLPKEPSKNK